MSAREIAAVALWDAFDYMLPVAPGDVAAVVFDAIEAAGYRISAV